MENPMDYQDIIDDIKDKAARECLNDPQSYYPVMAKAAISALKDLQRG
jgi:hypothetical protein